MVLKIIFKGFYIFITILKLIFLIYLFFTVLFNKWEEYKYDFKLKQYKLKIENYYKLCNNGTLLNKKKFLKNEIPKISIISPIYNREKYILTFLRSIQNQFFDNIEIIFVDDFSSDNSVESIENYQIEDERIILIKHNKNKGTLISRNDGALISKGEYLIFPDPDDILTQDILNTCYQYSKINNYEMIRYNLFDQRENDIFYNSIVNKLDSRRIEQPELFYYLFYGLGKLKQIDFNLNNKFIKREAFIRALNSINSFYLEQYMINLEDGIMNYILYKTSRSFYFLKNIEYFYIRNNQSITISQNINYNNRFKFIFLYINIVFDTTKNNKIEKEISILVFKWLLNLIKEGIKSITKEFNFFFDIINKYLKCKFIDKRTKIILKQLKFILYNISKKYV
jgi:glycosyltransferase involved in cell wall biosynthesis